MPIEKKAGRVPGAVWKLPRKEKSLVPAGNWAPDLCSVA